MGKWGTLFITFTFLSMAEISKVCHRYLKYATDILSLAVEPAGHDVLDLLQGLNATSADSLAGLRHTSGPNTSSPAILLEAYRLASDDTVVCPLLASDDTVVCPLLASDDTVVCPLLASDNTVFFFVWFNLSGISGIDKAEQIMIGAFIDLCRSLLQSAGRWKRPSWEVVDDATERRRYWKL
ncbi:hypothetical protein Btru_055117 [Bulinus truncatus]|nr:hypothetical protein Btru_055117 [Bulinus truncatus]